MNGEAKLSLIAILSIPALLMGATLLERVLHILPDECLALYIPLWLLLIIACPICGAISIGYSVIYRTNKIRSAIGLTIGFLQIGIGVYIILSINKMISIPMQT